MNLVLSRKGLVFVVVGLFIAVSIVPVNSLSIDPLSSKVDGMFENNSLFNSTCPYPVDGINIDERLSEREDNERDLYERYPWHYDRNLRNQSDYPFDEPFLDYPNYEEYSGIYSQKFNDEYVKNHALKDRKPIPKPNFAAGKTWYVDDDGGEDFTRIQDAIDAADDGDTVYVYSGTYYENVVVDKSIILQGEDRDNTIIDGGVSGDVVYVSAYWAGIEGFSIQNGNNGIRLSDSSDNNTIMGNTITDNNRDGIRLDHSSDNTITGNNINSNNNWGIFLHTSCNNNNIVGNIISNNGWDGIEIYSSSNNTIVDNVFQSNGIKIEGSTVEQWASHTIENNMANGRPIRYYKNTENVNVPGDTAQVILANCRHFLIQNLNTSDVDVGIQLGFSSDNMITGNTITDNNGDGIWLYYSSDNVVNYNIITNNKVIGIYMGDSLDNIITNNRFTSNGIIIGSWHLEYWNTHTIEENTLNSRNIYYFKNTNNECVPSDAGQVILANCSHMLIQNLNLSNGDYGLLLGFSSNNTIINNTITTNNDEGIYMVYSYDNTISGNIIKNNSWGGIYMDDSSGNKVSGNIIINNNESGLYMGDSLDNIFIGNTIANNEDNGIVMYYSSDNKISGNNIANNKDYGIKIWDSSDNIFNDNTISDNNDDGIYISSFKTGSLNNILSYNIISNNEHGIFLDESNRNSIVGNSCNNNTVDGIHIEDSSDNKISNCTFSSNLQYGIRIEESSGNIISNSTIKNHTVASSSSGISLFKSNNTIVKNCYISDNRKAGIELISSNDNNINGCLLDGNGWGIDFSNSGSNRVNLCSIVCNKYGGIREGKLNIITKNNFINNYNHYIHGKWFDTNIFLRNYWSGRLIQSPLPYRIFNLKFDWFPKTTPYDYHYLNETIVDYSANSSMNFNEQINSFPLTERLSDRFSSLFSKVYDVLNQDHCHLLNRWGDDR